MRRSRPSSRPWTSIASHLWENIFSRTPFEVRYRENRVYSRLEGTVKNTSACRSRVYAKAVLISRVAWPARCYYLSLRNPEIPRFPQRDPWEIRDDFT